MKFSHYYYKLNRTIFPTVRSINYLKSKGLKIGSIEQIHITGLYQGTAKLLLEEQKEISWMGLAFLKYDGDADGITINTEQDYVDLLNSFIPFKSNTRSTVKSILWWQWLTRLE